MFASAQTGCHGTALTSVLGSGGYRAESLGDGWSRNASARARSDHGGVSAEQQQRERAVAEAVAGVLCGRRRWSQQRTRSQGGRSLDRLASGGRTELAVEDPVLREEDLGIEDDLQHHWHEHAGEH
eukprot:2900343-Prymnesium_polylepis.2